MIEYGERQKDRQRRIDVFLADNPETFCTLGKAWNMTDEIMMDTRQVLTMRILNLCHNFEDMPLAAFYCARSGAFVLNEFITKLVAMVGEEKKLITKALDLAYKAYKQAGYPLGCHTIQGILQLQQST